MQMIHCANDEAHFFLLLLFVAYSELWITQLENLLEID